MYNMRILLLDLTYGRTMHDALTSMVKLKQAVTYDDEL